MVAVPAWVWRFGRIARTLIVGFTFGVVLGLLAMITVNSVAGGVVAIVLITLIFAPITFYRMREFWPGADDIRGADRMLAVRATRSGDDLRDARLAPAVIEYSRAMHDAGEHVILSRWLILLLAAVAMAVAISDTIFSSPGEAVASWLYFSFFPVELLAWPRMAARMVANAERAEESAKRLLTAGPAP